MAKEKNNKSSKNLYKEHLQTYIKKSNRNNKVVDLRKKKPSKQNYKKLNKKNLKTNRRDTQIQNISMSVEGKKINNSLFSNPNNIDIINMDDGQTTQMFIPLTGATSDNLGSLLSGKNDDIKLEKPNSNEAGLLDIIFKKLVSQGELDTLKENKPEEKKIEEKKEDTRKIKFIDEDIKCIDDLINLGKTCQDKYKSDEEYRWNIDVEALPKIVKPLENLQTMVGLEKVKDQLFCQLMFFLQGLDNKNKDMLHTVIEGNPGVGKTELSKIIGSIYKNLGILSSDKFVIAKRGDLIGSYLGQTTLKTQKLLDECKGGVLFIDEAYSLGNDEGKDSYSKECIDALTAHLSENKQDFICIIAGYKKQLKTCFFKYNPGLERRFPWRFTIDDYSDEELMNIYLKIVKENEWNINDSVNVEYFKKNRDYFKNNGGDMEILFHKTKLAHSLRSIKLSNEERKFINIEDMDKGLEMFLNDDEIKARNNNDEMLQYAIYT